MQAPHASTLALAILLPLLAWRVHSRFKRALGRQRLTKYRLWIQLSLFPALVVLVAMAASPSPGSLATFGISLAAGAALGKYGLSTTKFQPVPGNLFYTPNGRLGVALAVLFMLRIAYRLVEVYALEPAASRGAAEFARSPLTLFVFGLLAGYYIAYAAGLAIWRARVLKARRLRLQRAQGDA